MIEISQEHWISNYNTRLSKKKETEFIEWLDQDRVWVNVETNVVTHYTFRPNLAWYDLRGWWKFKDPKENDSGFLWSRKYDKPCCPTFSTKSIYHGIDNFHGGEWKYVFTNDDIFPLEEFYPSSSNLELFGIENLINHFTHGVGRRVFLVLPEDIETAIAESRETNIFLN